MGNWFSRDAGSMSSVTETFAFPSAIANRSHVPTSLWSYKDIKFAVLDNNTQSVFMWQDNFVPENIKSDAMNTLNSKKVIIFCHGNCMTVDERTISMLQGLQSQVKVPIYMLEYPGYGQSATLGKTTAQNCVEAVYQMVDYLKNEKNYEDKDIYFIGHSIGTGVVAQYISQNADVNYGGMILLSPYKSILSVAINNDALEYTSSSLNFYRTQDVIGNVKIPIMIIHGNDDDIINVSHSDRLKELNKNVILHKLKNVDHNNILEADKCTSLISDFVKSSLKSIVL